ncbi:hypothetical protein Bpfe_028136, partial [Biomphalaria pfeifferi]
FRETLSCAASKDIENANTEGCYNVLFDKTIGSRRILIIIFVFVIIGMEIIQAILAILLLIRPKLEEIEARKQAMMARNHKFSFLSPSPCSIVLYSANRIQGESGTFEDETRDSSLGNEADSVLKMDNLVFVPHAAMSTNPRQWGPPDTEIW